MDLSLRERFARLGPIQAVNHVQSGSEETVVLRLHRDRTTPKVVDATLLLTRRGLTMLKAKRAIETLLTKGRVFVRLPMVEDSKTLVAELAGAGFRAAIVKTGPSVDVRALRLRLGMTRDEFAVHYGLDIETLRNWEAGRRQPDQTARSYLQAIANDPVRVEEAFAPTNG